MHERSIFMEALDLSDPREQAAHLLRACGDDEQLRARVDDLLRSHRAAEGFVLDRMPELDFSATGDPSRALEGPGTTVGPYKLLELVGEGGMGQVYMAEQTRPVRRKVALKVIKPGMDTKQVIARFEAERQALALMDHPNIARVLDAGATDSGRPYFVMELVRGIPITEYCDREQLSIPERLDLFVLVCRAVQHAHQKGIIHRDIKPSNVLITPHDGVPVPKVIDFGIAKATGQSLTEKTLFTGFAQLVGTPLYMSPEQAGMSGIDVDTRSDVYSLGVLLYELLTGSTPFDGEAFRKAAIGELQRIIREDEPPTPSTRLSELGATLSTVSANRHSDSRKLGHAVRGELDWIVMKALEKDRTRRYETANDFAADVMRHLTDRPVDACPPSARYRFTKYARRNRTALVTTTLVATAIVLGMAVSTWQAVRARRADQRSTVALEESRLVVDFLVNDVFGAAAPEKVRGRTVTVHDILASGEKAIPARFGRRPLAEVAAREAIGRAQSDLGRYDQAAEQFRTAASLRSKFLGPDHPDTLESESLVVHNMVPPGIGSSLASTHEAEPIARRVLEVRRRALGPNHTKTLASMALLAHVLRLKFIQGLQDEVNHSPSLLVPGDVLKANAASFAEPRSLLEQAYAGQARLLGPEHPETLETLDALGLVLLHQGDFVGAEPLLRQATEGRLRVFGPAHPVTLRSQKHFAGSLRRLGRTNEAIRRFVEVAEGTREAYGPYHIQTSSALGYLMATLRPARDTATIREVNERWLREILATPADPNPFERSRRATRLQGLVLHLTTFPSPANFDADLAIRGAREAVAMSQRSSSWSVLGLVLERTGHSEESLEALRTASNRPDWTGGIAYHWFTLARLRARSGDSVGARECYERGLRDRSEIWVAELDYIRDECAALLGTKAHPGETIPKSAPESSRPPG